MSDHQEHDEPIFLGAFTLHIYEREEQKQFFDAAEKMYKGEKLWEVIKAETLSHDVEFVITKIVATSLEIGDEIKTSFLEQLYNAMIYYKSVVSNN